MGGVSMCKREEGVFVYSLVACGCLIIDTQARDGGVDRWVIHSPVDGIIEAVAIELNNHEKVTRSVLITNGQIVTTDHEMAAKKETLRKNLESVFQLPVRNIRAIHQGGKTFSEDIFIERDMYSVVESIEASGSTADATRKILSEGKHTLY